MAKPYGPQRRLSLRDAEALRFHITMRRAALLGTVPIAAAMLGVCEEAAIISARPALTGPVSAAVVQPRPLFGVGIRDVDPDGSRPPFARSSNSPRIVRQVLMDTAARHHVDPNLVLAVSYWESAWDQSKVSSSGAIGVMQVEPQVAAEAGPELLGRPVDLNDLWDNADVGVAILRQDLNAFGDPASALAAYYQGAASLQANGPYPDTQQYVQGILALRDRFAHGGPPSP